MTMFEGSYNGPVIGAGLGSRFGSLNYAVSDLTGYQNELSALFEYAIACKLYRLSGMGT